MKFTLQPDETLELDLSTAYVIWLPKFITSAILILLPFLFLFPLFYEGVVGIAVFSIVLAFGLWCGSRTWIRYRGTRLIVTSLRVIAFKQAGFFESLTREIPIDAIESVSARTKGFFSTVFRYGKLRIETRGQSKGLVFGPLFRPSQVQEFIYGILRDKKL